MPFLKFAIPRLLGSRACHTMCSSKNNATSIYCFVFLILKTNLTLYYFLGFPPRRMGLFHVVHCFGMVSVIAISMFLGGVFNYAPFESSKPVLDNPWEVYGGFAFILYLFRYLSLLALPQALASFFGLLLFNAFPETPKLKVFLFKLNWLKYLIFFKLEIITTSTNDLFPCCNQRRLS